MTGRTTAVAKSAKCGTGAPKGFRRLNMNLREDLHKELRRAAIDADCTITDLVEVLVLQHLARVVESKSLQEFHKAIAERVTA